MWKKANSIAMRGIWEEVASVKQGAAVGGADEEGREQSERVGAREADKGGKSTVRKLGITRAQQVLARVPRPPAQRRRQKVKAVGVRPL